MDIKIGDYVTRNSYNNDVVFVVIDIQDDIYYLKGFNVRLCADSPKEDLKLYNQENVLEDDSKIIERIREASSLDRDDYFYLPGKILHIDGDCDYLNRCINYYNNINLMSMGICLKEEDMPIKIRELLEEYNPSILVISGHDAYFKKKGSKEDLNAYKNSFNFVETVKEARRFENSHEKLVIIAGACQSNYEELIKAGANFASSPKRINIHALDPAIVASKMSLADINKDIDIKEIISNTKYGKDGIGGIITKGTMYMGYPR